MPQVARIVSSGRVVETAEHNALDHPAERCDDDEDRDQARQQPQPMEFRLEQPQAA